MEFDDRVVGWPDVSPVPKALTGVDVTVDEEAEEDAMVEVMLVEVALSAVRVELSRDADETIRELPPPMPPWRGRSCYNGDISTMNRK